MQPELLVSLFVLAVAALVGAVIYYAHQEYQAALRTWAAFAASRGLQYAAPEGWLFRTAPRITGTIEQIAFTIDTFTVSHGKSSTTYTRVRARAIDPIPSAVKVYNAHFLSGLGKLLGFQDVPVGDAVFDEKYVVKADVEADARALLDAPTRRSLLEFPRTMSFTYDRGDVDVHWVGVEKHADALDAACRIVAAACRWRREPEIYR